MKRHRAFVVAAICTAVFGAAVWAFTRSWPGWEYIHEMVSKGDNMPIAGLIPLVVFFTYLALSEAFRHDRLIRQGRARDIRQEMYK